MTLIILDTFHTTGMKATAMCCLGVRLDVFLSDSTVWFYWCTIKQGAGREKRSFCYADQKTESGECEQWRLKMTGLPNLRAVFVCLVSHCRTHGKRKRKWLIIGVRNWHILMACGYKIKVILCLSTAGEVWSLPTRQRTAVICFSWILTFQFSAMLKSKDCSTLVGKKSYNVGLILSLRISPFSNTKCLKTARHHQQSLNQSISNPVRSYWSYIPECDISKSLTEYEPQLEWPPRWSVQPSARTFRRSAEEKEGEKKQANLKQFKFISQPSRPPSSRL